MYCDQCGAQALPDAVYCRSCGTKLEREAARVGGGSYEQTFEHETIVEGDLIEQPAYPVVRYSAPLSPRMLDGLSAPLRLDTGVASLSDTEKPLIRRPLTIALLMLASFGLYYFVWFYRVRRFAEERLNEPNRAALYTALLVVPGVNLVVALITSDLVVRALGETAAWRMKFAFATLAFFFFAGCSALPYPWWALVFLGFVPVAMMHARIVGAIVADRVINKRLLALSSIQTALVAFGVVLVVLATANLIIGATPLGYVVGFGVLALVALALRWFAAMRSWKTVDRPIPVDHFGLAT